MALIMMCGIPCSGKSRRAQELAQWLRDSHNMEVVVINEESEGVEKSSGYKSGREEKVSRAALFSAVERNTGPHCAVIVDSLNYIKGFRYQLYCVAKEQRVPHVVLHCRASLETALEWHGAGEQDNAFTAHQVEDLASRFEAPHERNRWDRPLLSVTSDSKLPFEALERALFKSRIAPPNVSTKGEKPSAASFVYNMDKMLTAIIKDIMEAQNAGVAPGAQVKVKSASVAVHLVRPVGVPELRRLKRAYVSLVQMNKPRAEEVADSFIRYVNQQLLV